jgi:hypothetical protein
MGQYARENTRGPAYFEHKQWLAFKSVIQKKNDAISEFLEHDRLLLVFVAPLSCQYDFVTEQGNLESTKLSSFCPRPLIGAKAVEGTKVSVANAAPKEFREFLNSIKDNIRYLGSFSQEQGIPLLNIEGTQKVVAAWYPTKNGGGTIYCPYPIENSSCVNKFFEALIKLCIQLKNGVRKELPHLPEWHVNFQLPAEVKQIIEIEKLKTEINNLNALLIKAESHLDEVLLLKRLITDQGDSLLEAAAMAFRLLGLTVALGPEGRDDLILDGLESRKFVVEVKGRDNKSAAESDSAQLEKWVARYYEEQNVEPKGVLIINGHRTTPLNERKEPVFPNQMLAYAQKREHCLMAGYQLLAHVLAVQQGKISAQEAQESIVNALGICQRFSNIDDCIALLAHNNIE